MAQNGARIRIVRVYESDAIAQQIVPSMNNLTSNVASRMRRLVPKREWRLHDTIDDRGAKVKGGVVTGTVAVGGKVVRGVLVDYWEHVERGTSQMMAQPYMRPALLQSRASDLRQGASS